MKADPIVRAFVNATVRAIDGDRLALSRCLEQLVAPLETVDLPALETILKAWSRACWIVDRERKCEERERAAEATSAKPTTRRRRGKKEELEP